MRKRLGVMFMEDDNGVAVELFRKPDTAKAAFAELIGQPGDQPSRATFFVIDWEQQKVSDFQSKELPIVRGLDDEPWGHRLGVGLIDGPKEDDATEQ